MDPAVATFIGNSKKEVSRYKSYLHPLRKLELWLYGHNASASWHQPFLAPSQTTALTPSPLLQLPHELLLEIAAYLSPADLMSLQDTSPQIPTLINAATIQWIDRVHYANRLHCEDFARACAEEEAGNLWYRRLICSACMDIHPRSCFSAAAVRRGPSYRRCTISNAVNGFLYICAHWSVTHAELMAVVAGRPLSSQPGRDGLLYCQDSTHIEDQSRGIRKTLGAVQLCTWAPYTQGIIFVWQWLFNICVVPGDVTTVRDALARARIPVCTHIHTSELSIMRTSVQNAGVEGRFFDLNGPGTRKNGRTDALFCKRCAGLTVCSLRQRYIDDGMTEVILELERAIPRDACAEDPKWLALVDY